MDEYIKGMIVGGGIAIGTVVTLGLLGYAIYKNEIKQQQRTTTTTSTTSTTQTTSSSSSSTSQQQGYTVTIINSCYPIVTANQPSVLVVYTDVDKTQKSVIIGYNQQVTIQVYPNSIIGFYIPETTPMPVSSSNSGISPYVITTSKSTWKLIQQITITQNMTLQVCDETVTQAGNGGIIQPL